MSTYFHYLQRHFLNGYFSTSPEQAPCSLVSRGTWLFLLLSSLARVLKLLCIPPCLRRSISMEFSSWRHLWMTSCVDDLLCGRPQLWCRGSDSFVQHKNIPPEVLHILNNYSSSQIGKALLHLGLSVLRLERCLWLRRFLSSVNFSVGKINT